jgi:Na+-transporting methylmalonyl-CoA/oxaloacetate decarboxylase gamma subunit
MFNPDPALVTAGLQVMAMGLTGVFTVLILFYFATKGMVYFATKWSKKKEE